jgi:hypothetical protein
MPATLTDDRDLTAAQVQSLSSAEALAAILTYLGYPADTRLTMTAEALGLPADLARQVKRMERLTTVENGALEVYLFELKSVTVGHTRSLARVFRDRAGSYLLILTDDYDRLDFVLLERVLPESSSQGITRRGISLRPRVLTVDRRNPDPVALRVLRRFTFTEADADGEPDPYAQYDKLQSAYVVAEWSEPRPLLRLLPQPASADTAGVERPGPQSSLPRHSRPHGRGPPPLQWPTRLGLSPAAHPALAGNAGVPGGNPSRRRKFLRFSSVCRVSFICKGRSIGFCPCLSLEPFSGWEG